jgi:hypothetical protein
MYLSSSLIKKVENKSHRLSNDFNKALHVSICFDLRIRAFGFFTFPNPINLYDNILHTGDGLERYESIVGCTSEQIGN